MKCHAGVEFESGKPCPKCNARLGNVCWPGINSDLTELVELRRLAKGAVEEFPVASGLYVDTDGQDGYGNLRALRLHLQKAGALSSTSRNTTAE